MKLSIIMFFAGALFAVGLTLGGMTDPGKVTGFLDVTRDWDPTLMFVLFPAVIVYGVGFWLLRPRLAAPWCAAEFSLPSQRNITTQLVAGAAIFGIGWGLVGLCPGPAIARLFSVDIAIFVAAMWVGMLLANWMKNRLTPAQTL